MSRHFDSVIEPADAPEPPGIEPNTDELIEQFYENLLWEPDYESLPSN